MGVLLTLSAMGKLPFCAYREEGRSQHSCSSDRCHAMKALLLLFIGCSLFCMQNTGLAASYEAVRLNGGQPIITQAMFTVLGADIIRLVNHLSSRFFVWVLIANGVAWPVTWFLMQRWLEQFAYRIQPAPWMFAAAALLSLLMVAMTIGFQTLKAARANPVEALRYE